MKQKNRETIERAIGIICGISFCTEGKVSDALLDTAAMLDAILNDEEENTDGNI